MSNMRQWGQALQMYVGGNKGIMPTSTSDTPYAIWNDPSAWFNALPPMVRQPAYTDLQGSTRWSVNGTSQNGGTASLPGLGDSSLFVCPSAGAIGGISSDVTNGSHFLVTGVTRTAADGPQFASWPQPLNGIGNTRAVLLSYVINSKLFYSNKNSVPPVFESWDASIANQKTPRPLPISKLKPGAETVFMTEMRHSVGEIPKGMDAYYESQGGQSGRLSTRDLSRLKADWQRFAGRHRQGGNLLFIDGHVSWFTMKDVVTPSVNGGTIVPDAEAGPQGGNWNRPGSFIWDARHPTGK